MDVIDLYIFDNAGTTTAVVAPIELQHTEQAYTLYARIPGDTAIGDGYAVGFKCIDNRFRIFDITDHTAMEPDDVIEINAIDQAVRELTDEPITDLRPQNVTVTKAVTRLISSTRFIIGNVSCSNTGGMTAYYESVWDALVDAQAAFDCVLVPYFEITGGIITARKIDILARNGADRGRIFELGDDLADIRIKYDESQIKTALFGRGRGVELDGGDGDPTYGRRLTFADVAWSTSDGDPADKPEGQEWIGDPDALAAYSRDGRHRFGFVTFDSEEDADALLQKTWDKLQELKQPRITIECTVLDTERTMGRSHEAVRYGDGVLVRIAKRGIDIDAKVSGIVRDYIRPERTKLTIGNAAPSAGKIVADLQATLDNYSGRASVWDRSSAFDIDGAMDVMNNQILSTVGGWYTDPDTGAIMLVSQDGAKAMRLTGAGWQIASEKVGDAWVWRTAATGGGIVADQITTGVLNANLIRAGTLSADRIGASSLSLGKLATGSVFSTIADSGVTVTHGSASNAYTTLDASGLRIYNSAGSMIGGLYVPTGQSAVKMGASSLMNPSYPNFSIQMESQWSGEAMAYYYMLSFFRRNTFAFGLGVEDDDNFSGGFVMDKNGNSASLDTIIEVAKTWSGVDPSALTATEVNYGTDQMHIWQESSNVYFKSPGDIFLIMNINGHSCTLRMSDVYDLLNP